MKTVNDNDFNEFVLLFIFQILCAMGIAISIEEQSVLGVVTYVILYLIAITLIYHIFHRKELMKTNDLDLNLVAITITLLVSVPFIYFSAIGGAIKFVIIWLLAFAFLVYIALF